MVLKPSGSNAAVWSVSTFFSISLIVIPPILLTVSVKYSSITSLLIPIASKICEP